MRRREQLTEARVEDYYGLIELVLLVLSLVGGWLVLERQGRKLDARRDAEKARQDTLRPD
jgi:hypothetical protein